MKDKTMEQELENINSTILALHFLLISLQIERTYIEACIKNPCLSNLEILFNHRKLHEKFILSIKENE